MRILFLAVNYFSDEDISLLAKDLLNQKGCYRLDVVFVDNSKTLTNSKYWKYDRASDNRRNRRIKIEVPDSNKGYLGGAFWALQRHVAEQGGPDWVVVSNPDIRVPDEYFFDNIVKLYSCNEPAVLAPSILSFPELSDENPHMLTRPSSYKILFYKSLYGSYLASAIYQVASLAKRKAVLSGRQEKASSVRHLSPRPIYAPHGAFLVFNKLFFSNGGTIKYPPFLFAEEIFIAEQCRRHGLPVIYDPRVRVYHAAHVTTGVFKNRRMIQFKREAFCYLYETFFKG